MPGFLGSGSALHERRRKGDRHKDTPPSPGVTTWSWTLQVTAARLTDLEAQPRCPERRCKARADWLLRHRDWLDAASHLQRKFWVFRVHPRPSAGLVFGFCLPRGLSETPLGRAGVSWRSKGHVFRDGPTPDDGVVEIAAEPRSPPGAAPPLSSLFSHCCYS